MRSSARTLRVQIQGGCRGRCARLLGVPAALLSPRALIRNALARIRIMPQRAAIYLRVSTDRQSTENQRPEVEQLARARGFEVVTTYEETMSAAKKAPNTSRC